MIILLLSYIALASAVLAMLSCYAFVVVARFPDKDLNMLCWAAVSSVLFTGVTVSVVKVIQYMI